MANITPGDIDRWFLKLDVADGTRDHIRTTLRVIFREAMRERYLDSNPMKYVEPSKIVRISNEPPKMEELRKIFPVDKEHFFKVWPTIHYGVMCAVMASSGLRMQEIRAMTPKCIVKEK